MEFSTHFSFQSPGPLHQLLFHPALNTVFGCSESGQLYCFDTSSGNLIKRYEVPRDIESRLLISLLPSKDRFVICHGRCFNARTELNGTLLLDSILQSRVQCSNDEVVVDLSHADAVYFLKVLQSFDPAKYEEDLNVKEFQTFVSKLAEAVTESEKRLNALPTKLTRWETVSIKAEFSIWKAIVIVVLRHILPVNCLGEVGMPNQGATNPNYQDAPGLPVLAAIMDRLRRLAPPGDEITQQGSVQLSRTMNAEVDRKATFALWPHMDYKWALPDQMAQAGFFQSSGSADAEDRALCFICRVCLVCWESTDEPWAEHERHSENCPFVKGQYTHNIPIRVTHGTETAICLKERHSKITHLSTTNSQTLIATASADGEVVIWDMTLRIRQVARFNINKAAACSGAADAEAVTITSLCLMDVTSQRARENFVHEHLLIVSTNQHKEDREDTAHLYAFEIRQVVQVLVGRSQFIGKYSTTEPELANSEDESDPPSYWDGLLAKLQSKESKLQQEDDYIMGSISDDDVDEEIAGITANTSVEIVISSGNLDCDLGFPPMDVSPPVPTNNCLPSGQNSTQSQRTTQSMDEWTRLNYCLGEYRCSGHHAIDLENGTVIKQIIPYPGPHRHANMFICLFNIMVQGEERPKAGGVLVYRGIREELSRITFTKENTPIQICPMEPDPCDPDVAPTNGSGGCGEDSDDTVEPVPPKKTKATVCFGEDPLGATSTSMVLSSGSRGLPPALLASVTADGDLAVLDVQRCESRYAARYCGNFTCVEFCSGMDRLCAAAVDGKVSFLSVGNSDMSDESTHPELVGLTGFEEIVADGLSGTSLAGQANPGASCIEGSASNQGAPVDLFDDPELLINSLRDNLSILHELVQYEPVMGRVHVSLPPCWSQIEREEYQSAPLHNFGYSAVQMMNQGLSASSRISGGTTSAGPPGSRPVNEAFVGSWKLTPDGSTWREHVMEIVFPKIVNVGHIDLKIRLQDMPPGTSAAQSIYITLLRQNVSSQTSPNSLGTSAEATSQTSGLSGLEALAAAACMQEMMTGTDMGLTLTDLDAPFIDDDHPETNQKSSGQPPVISEYQLRQLNAEVIAGPYRLADYLDLSGQTAVIPLTSVDLIKVRTRFYAVYISAPVKEPQPGYRRMIVGLAHAQASAQRSVGVSTKQGPGQRKTKAKLWTEKIHTQGTAFQFPHVNVSPSSGNITANTTTGANNMTGNGTGTSGKTADWYGCDIIRQVTLTIHRFKRIPPIPRERVQRMAILRNNEFHVHLIEILAGGQLTPFNVMRVLDILNWVVVMYANDIHIKGSSIYLLLSRVAGQLDSIIRYRMIMGDRSTAKKVARFLLQLTELEKNGLLDEKKSADPSSESHHPFFHACLLDCLLNNLPLLLLSESPAGVRWYFFLLGRLRGVDVTQATQHAACLLRELTGIYKERTADLNLALLRSDFGIFSNPLDPVLFDIDASNVLEENRNGLGSCNSGSANENVTGKPQTYAGAVTSKSSASSGVGSDWRGTVKNGPVTGELLSSIDLLKDVLPLLSSSASYDLLYDEADWRACGLTETEPLHFTCHTSSSDTKLERGNGSLDLGSVNVPQPSQQLDVPFEPFLSNVSPLYKAKQHQLMKLHLKKQLLEAKLTEAKKAVQQQHLQALQTAYNHLQSVSKSMTPPGAPSMAQSPWHIPSTPQTTPAATADTTPKHCTPSVSPPNEAKASRSDSLPSNGTGATRAAAAAAAAAVIGSPLIKSAWCQHLLSPPVPHEMVMERNHGGARRFVVLDFGRAVYLTDVLIPANEQLSSLSLDAWLHYEDLDGQRLVHVTDIATRPLVLCDLQPPTVCRYLKITVCSSFKVASLAQRSRVRIGNFYGHSVPHPEAISTSATHPLIHAELEAHIQQVAAVLEDNRCRYGLARDLLRRHLRAYYPTTTTPASGASNTNAGGTGSTNSISGSSSTISGVNSTPSGGPGGSSDTAFMRLRSAVQQCFVLQRLVNVSLRTLERLQRILAGRNPNISLLDRLGADASISGESISRLAAYASTDKIRVMIEASLSFILFCQSAPACEDTVASGSFIQSLEVGQCVLQKPGGDALSSVFRDLIAYGTRRMQVMSCCLFSDLCCVASITKQLDLRAWLKEWLSGMLRSFFAASSDQIVPRSRVFLLICTSLQRLISAGLGRLILTDLLKTLEELLSPLLDSSSTSQPFCFIDQELLNWMLLLTTKALDYLPRKDTDVSQRHQPRWDFLSWHHRQKRRAKRGYSSSSGSAGGHRSTNIYTPTVVHSNSKSVGKTIFSGPDFNPKLIKKKLHKRLLHHRDQLMNLTKSQEDFLNVTMAQQTDTSNQNTGKTHFGGKEAAKLYIIKKKEDEFNSKLQLITKKHVKDMLQIRKNDLDSYRRATKRTPKEHFQGCSRGTGSNAAQIPTLPSTSAVSSQPGESGTTALLCPLTKERAVPVVKLLFTLLCRLDASCSSDTFLRTCKLIGHIMRTCRPALHLSDAVKEDVVITLLHRFASASLVSALGESWAGPYGLHAVACLFSDLLDSEEEQSQTVQTTPIQLTPKSEQVMAPIALQEEPGMSPEETGGPMVETQTSQTDIDFLKHIDLFESDDSEGASIDMREGKTRNEDYLKIDGNEPLSDASKGTQEAASNANVSAAELVSRFIMVNFSSAYDCRLEHGLEWRQEMELMRYMAQTQVSCNMTLAQASVIANPHVVSDAEDSPKDGGSTSNDTSYKSAKILLARCLNDLIRRQRAENLYLMPLLQLWLLLNQRSTERPSAGQKRASSESTSAHTGPTGSGESDVDSGAVNNTLTQWSSVTQPSLPLTKDSLTALLRSLTEEPHPLSVLHMGLRVIVLACNQCGEEELVPFLLNSNEFKSFLIRLLNTSPPDRQGNLVGPATLDLIEELLFRLRLYCPAENKGLFAPFVAGILSQLTVVDSGPLFAGYGPVDLQCKWVLSVCDENFSLCDTALLINLVYSISRLALRQLRLLTPSLTPQWSSSGSSGMMAGAKENQISKAERGMPPPHVCFTSVCSSSGVLTKNDPDKSYEALCNRNRLVTALMSLLHHIVAPKSSMDGGMARDPRVSRDNRADEQKILDTNNSAPQLADVILNDGDGQPVQQLLCCLSLCVSNVFSGLGADLSLSELSREMMPNLQPRSIGDWTLLSLKRIYSHCSSRQTFLDALLSFLSSSPASAIHEPLLLFVAWILSDESPPSKSGENLRYFLTQGGLRDVATRFVEVARQMIGTQSSCVRSTEVDLLTGDPSASRLPLDEDSPANLAPVCIITCGSGGLGGSSSGSECLLQSTQAIHRRVKAAQWSYNFFPDESYTELCIRVPSPALLAELIVVPHLVSLQSAPSAISFELHMDGALVYSLSGPVPTAGMPQVRISLPPTLANAVILRLHRPRDVDSVGLSHVQLRGYSLFSARLPHSGGLSPVFAWLRLFHFVLDAAANNANPSISSSDVVGDVVEQVPALLPHLCAQITSGGQDAMSPSSSSCIAETVLLTLGRLCPSASLQILRCLLKMPISDEKDSNHGPLFYQWEGVESNTGTENLIYRLAHERDDWTGERMSLLLQWLTSVSCRQAMSVSSDLYIEPLSSVVVPGLHVGCIAVILWEASTEMDSFAGHAQWRSELVTEQLLQNVYQWYLAVCPQNPDMRRALACLMCSLCALSPNLFTRLLDWTKISGMIRLTDDSKSLLNDKSVPAWPGREQLEVLAVVSQSRACLPQLFSSGLLELLSTQLLRFSKYHLRQAAFIHPWNNFIGDMDFDSDMAKFTRKKAQAERGYQFGQYSTTFTGEGASSILQFLTQLMEGNSRVNSWLGSAENIAFWRPLVALLMIGPSFQPSVNTLGGLSDSDRIALEQAAIEYFVTVTRFSDANQARFSQMVCDALLTLSAQVSSRVSMSESLESSAAQGVPLCLPSFLRRLILQVMLEEGHVEVVLRTPSDEEDDILPRQLPSSLTHPELGAGYGRYIHHGLATDSLATMAEELLRQRSMQGNLSSGSSGASLASASSHPLLTNVSSLAPVEEKLSTLSAQGGLAEFHTTSQALQLLDQISTSAGLNINLNKKSAATPSLNKKSGTSTQKEVGTAKTPQTETRDTGDMALHFLACMDALVKFEFRHHLLGDHPLPMGCTLGQLLLAVSKSEGYIPSRLELTVRSHRSRKSIISGGLSTPDTVDLRDEAASRNPIESTSAVETPEESNSLNWCLNLREQPPTPLDSFAAISGLCALAELLHLLVPGICRLNMAGGSSESHSEAQKRQNTGSDKNAMQQAICNWSVIPSKQTPSVHNVQASQEVWEDFTFSSDMDFDPYSDYLNSGGFISMADLQSQVMMGTGSRAGRAGPCPQGTLPALPAHTLIAFALFLRLTGYADLLLSRERRLAICLLRLMMGVTEDANGDSLLTGGDSSSLPQLPFTVLCQLLRAATPGTDDAAMLQRRCLDLGIVELCLASLAVLSHQEPANGATPTHPVVAMTVEALQAQMSSGKRKPEAAPRTSGASGVPASSTMPQMSATSAEQQILSAQQQQQKLYWAKGTGFGTGSTVSNWDAEQTFLRQKMEEEHCTAILHVLAAFIRPGPDILDGVSDLTTLPPFNSTGPSGLGLNASRVLQMLQDSCLVAAMASYLRNDSVLDMARHVSLYRALLVVLRSLALDPELRVLLRAQPSDSSPTDISSLLASMKRCVDTYAARLKVGTKVTRTESEQELESMTANSDENIGDGAGLAQLIPDIQKTADLVEQALRPPTPSNLMEGQEGARDRSRNGESPRCSQDYCTRMKPLQFDTYTMIRECSDGSVVFLVPHFHSSIIQQQYYSGSGGSASRSRRLAQETVTLSTSLPLSESSSVFVRCDEDRLDVMKALITGPVDTPYANGCFEFDVYFPTDYPKSPPQVQLKTTGNQTVRFNPNLYNCGKVCLSILNTWHGRPEEKWNGKTSSFLQVLVSIQSLILVSEPYFNEPGYERSRGTPCGTIASRDYDANIRQATVRWGMLDMLRRPPECFREVVLNHFYLKKDEILKQVNDWINEMAAYTNSGTTSSATQGLQPPPPPPPPGTPSTSATSMANHTTFAGVSSTVTNSVAKHSLIQLKKYFAQLQEELNKLKDPAEFSSEELRNDNQQVVRPSVGSPSPVSQPTNVKAVTQSHKGFDVVDTPLPQTSKSIDQDHNNDDDDDGIIL